MNVDFVNRSYELDRICSPGAHRFIVVDGPAGYGKSWLLRRVRETYAERDGWKIALVDLKADPAMGASDIFVAWPAICRAIAHELPGSSPMRIATDHRNEQQLKRDLRAEMEIVLAQMQGANILLLFDGVEVLTGQTSAWLKELISTLDEALRNQAGRELRVTCAGRYMGSWARDAQYPMALVHLSPFDRVAVGEMVRQYPQARYGRPDRLDELAWWTLQMSGGHPQAICDLLTVIADAGCFLTDPKLVLAEREFVREGRQGTLFELCVQPIIDDMLQKVPSALRPVFQAISCLRRFNPDLLDELGRQGLLNGSGYSLTQKLVTTRLIRQPTISDPMYSDQILRRMLAEKMRLQDAEGFQRINSLACEIWDRWAVDSEKQDQVRRVAAIESLYHIVQMEPEAVPPPNPELRRKLLDRLDAYISAIQQDSYRAQLEDALANDQELLDLIEQRAGRNTVGELLSRLR